jgi:hypothetical protein
MKKTIIVNDKMQKAYTYVLTEPIGKNFDPDFKPQLTPKEMLSLGIFGGIYMRDCTKEFPKDWFTEAKFAIGNIQNKNLNYFKVKASQSLKIWKEKGWINEADPRGWFQWYNRYYMGRRIDDDKRQIKRWRAMTRHIAQIRKGCKEGDMTCRIKQRQALLHWAYDTRT